jgi:thioredoxin 1
MTELTADSFDPFIQESNAALVDFWAPWCGSCKAFGSMLEELEAELKLDSTIPEVMFAKVDVSEYPELADRFGITALPTIVLFRNGDPFVKQAGAVSRGAIGDLIRHEGMN